MRKKNLILYAIAFTGTLAAPLMGQSHTTPTPGAHSEAPDIFGGDLGNAVFTLAIFIVLMLILKKWAWQPLLNGLQKREEHIRREIENTEKARGDAQNILDEYKQQLKNAQKEAQEILTQAQSEAALLAENFKQQAQQDAQILRIQNQKDIEDAKNQALKLIYDQTTDLAADLAGRIIHKDLKLNDHQELLQESIKKMQDQISRN